MTLSDLLSNDTLRREAFPVTGHKTFLAHAGVSPLPGIVSNAMRDYLVIAAQDNQEDIIGDGIIRETRALCARLIGCDPVEIAFTGSTSMGLAMVATGLPWQTGDNVVCYQDDYPANVYPWMDLQRKGVEVRFVDPAVYGRITIDDLAGMIDGNTRLVSLASAHFLSGWRLDVDGIGKFLHERGVLFCLDSIQTFGALRTMVAHVDFASADAHKWLLGPLGIAVFYVNKKRMNLLHPTLVGWSSAPCPDFVAQEKLTFWPDARRYEPGSANLTGIVGLHAALQMIHGFGLDSVERRVLALARRCVDGVQNRGYEVVGPTDPDALTGIVTFVRPDRDMAVLHRKMMAEGVVTSLRKKRDGSRCIRVSAHCYNTEADIDRVLEMLE
jgi:selenocysteine lyase/cysteine desulfurase